MLAAGFVAAAQNEQDVLRYSLTSTQGSARSLGLGGAWGAVGADLSSASINPAGLALYRRNEFMGSMAVTTTRNEAIYNGSSATDSRTNFNVPNFGVAFTVNNGYMGKDQTHSGVTSGTFAFGLNRLADFQNNMAMAGIGRNTTVGDYLAAQAWGTDSAAMYSSDYDNTLFAQARRLYLIDNAGSATQYDSWQNLVGDTNYTMRQQNTIQNRGRINEWYVSGGLNFGHTLYLGASMVVQGVRFSTDNVYREDLDKSSLSNNIYRYSIITQSVETRGSGVGGKFGLIFRPIDLIRIGFAYHTPVRLNLTDEYTNTLRLNQSGQEYLQQPSNFSTYEYQVVTPGRMTTSAALVLSKFLLLSADWERVDYTAGRLVDKLGFANYAPANDNVKSTFAVANNVRAGLELATGYTRWRLGYGIMGSPYNENVVSKENGIRQQYSAGFGWLYGDSYFFDIAVNGIAGKNYITPYDGIPSSALNESLRLNFMFGMGVRF